MKLRYAVLADYAASDPSGKHTIVGIFEMVYDVLGTKPVPMPPCYIAAAITANAAEGTAHRLQIRLRRDSPGDMSEVVPALEMPFQMAPSGPGQPLRGGLNLFIPNMRVPERGDYAFELVVDGKSLGRIPFRVVAPPNEPPGP